MKIAIPAEADETEPRVAASPDSVKKMRALGAEVLVEAGAGARAGVPDAEYEAAGAGIARGAEVVRDADVILKVRRPTAGEAERYKKGALVIGIMDPFGNEPALAALAKAGVTAFAMELLPRITRAQGMDVLSSQANLAGYRAVIDAAYEYGRALPMMMTAAGTVPGARVFVMGAGVAGLQAVATARRLGAIVTATDVRPAAKEQVESLGAKFVELGLETKDAEAKTGYAKAQSEEFYQKQRAALSHFVAAADVVIPTALVPGQRAPVLITAEMVQAMRPGSLIVDLAADQAGNCALTEPGQDTFKDGVLIMGPLNIASSMHFHASHMYSRTVVNFLLHLVKQGKLQLDLSDELSRGPLVTHEGKVVHPAAQ